MLVQRVPIYFFLVIPALFHKVFSQILCFCCLPVLGRVLCPESGWNWAYYMVPAVSCTLFQGRSFPNLTNKKGVQGWKEAKVEKRLPRLKRSLPRLNKSPLRLKKSFPRLKKTTTPFWLVLIGILESEVESSATLQKAPKTEIFPPQKLSLLCFDLFGPFHVFSPSKLQIATSNWTHIGHCVFVQAASSLTPAGRSSYASAEIAFDGGTSPCASVWSWDIGILWFLETWSVMNLWTIMNLSTTGLYKEWIRKTC